MGLGTMLASAVVGTAASAATSAIQNSMNQSNASTQFGRSQQLMREQTELNQKNWEKQFSMINQYNSPENQLALKQAAGLNPLFSEGNAVSSASPSASTSSLPSINAPESVDFAGIFNQVFSNLFAFKNLQNQTNLTESQVEKNQAETDATNKDIVNKTNTSNSQIAVDNAKVQELLSQKNLNDEQQMYVKQQTAANKELVKQKWAELNLKSQELGQLARRISNEEYTSRWQEAVGKVNAKSNSLSSQASMSQAKTAASVFEFGLNKWKSEFSLQVAKFSKQCTNENIDNWIKIADISGINFMGTRFIDEKWIPQASAICQSFVNNIDKLDEQSFSKALPIFLNLSQKLENVEVSVNMPKPKKKNTYNPAPWFPDEM